MAGLVDIRAGDLLRPEHADLVAAFLLEMAIGDEQVPPAARMDQIGAFSGVAVSAGDLHAVVGVGGIMLCEVVRCVVAQPCGRVEPQHPDPAEP